MHCDSHFVYEEGKISCIFTLTHWNYIELFEFDFFIAHMMNILLGLASFQDLALEDIA